MRKLVMLLLDDAAEGEGLSLGKPVSDLVLHAEDGHLLSRVALFY
jgi:hypothetical protein